jgi:uncharacterized Zn finger protein
MARENYAAKGRRYLIEGRLDVTRVDRQAIEAACRGDGAEVYRLGWEPGGFWCDCPALGRCAHLQALMLVVIRSRGAA